MAGWLCKRCLKEKTYRRSKLCGKCDAANPNGRRGLHNKKVAPARRVRGKSTMLKQTNPACRVRGKSTMLKHSNQRPAAAPSGRAFDLRVALELEYLPLTTVCDLAESHGLLAQSHMIVRAIDQSGQGLPEATPTYVMALLFCAVKLSVHFADEDSDAVRRKLRLAANLDWKAVRSAEYVWANLLGACDCGYLWK